MQLLKHNSEQLEVHVLPSFKSKLKIKSAWFDNNVIYAFEINQIAVNKLQQFKSVDQWNIQMGKISLIQCIMVNLLFSVLLQMKLEVAISSHHRSFCTSGPQNPQQFEIKITLGHWNSYNQDHVVHHVRREQNYLWKTFGIIWLVLLSTNKSYNKT